MNGLPNRALVFVALDFGRGYFELEESMDIKKDDKEPLKAKEGRVITTVRNDIFKRFT